MTVAEQVVIGVETDRGPWAAALREYFPAALLAFDDLAAADVLEMLGGSTL